jgi:hypothetical protein
LTQINVIESQIASQSIFDSHKGYTSTRQHKNRYKI